MAIWKEYFENSYVSCFHYLVNRKLHWSERVFWLIAILVSGGITYYVMSRNFADFGQQKPMFKVDTNYLDWVVDYPSVVICERRYTVLSPTLKRLLDKYLQENLGDKFGSTDIDDLRCKIGFIAFMRMDTIPAILRYCDTHTCIDGNFTGLFKAVKQSCESLFAYCKYNDEVFNCCDEFLPMDTSFGKCYGFNNYGARYQNETRHVKNMKWNIIRRPGLATGTLYLEFKTPLVLIYVLGPLGAPHISNDHLIYKLGHLLQEAHEYYHRVNLKEIITLDEESSSTVEIRGCRFPHENNLTYFDFYTEDNCIVDCFMTTQKRHCGCILHTYPIPSSEHCSITQFLCLKDISTLMNCYCLPDCNQMEIHDVGSLERPIKTPLIDRSSSISFKLEVPAPTIRYMRYSLKSPLTVIVTVGSVLGFFLGVSYLSLAQVFYYFFIRSITDWVAAKRDKKKRDKEDKMDENFRIARMKLSLEKVEKDMHLRMAEKIEKLDSKEE